MNTEHRRFDYSPIVDRKPLKFPKGARVAVWVVPNIEHFLFDRPATSIVAKTASLVPDVLNYSWRDFGVRVGVWRMMEIMERHGIRGTAAVNADACRNYPRIVEAGLKLGWEWMGHGMNNSTLLNAQSEAEERAIIRACLDTVTGATGKRPRGWLSPALSETFNTLDLLAEAGFEYVANWVNDEQPYPMKVKSGKLFSIPYSEELNDIPAVLDQKQSPEAFYRMIVDQLDMLHADGAKTGRVMSICLHPFIMGQAYRAKYLDLALGYVAAHEGVWLATGGEIIDWYRKATSEGS